MPKHNLVKIMNFKNTRIQTKHDQKNPPNKNKSIWLQISLQCQVRGDNKVMSINAEGKGGYSKNSILSKTGIKCEGNKISSNMPALKKCIIHVPFLKSLFNDILMKMSQNAGLCGRHYIPSKYNQKEIQGYNFNFRQGKHKELTNKQDKYCFLIDKGVV